MVKWKEFSRAAKKMNSVAELKAALEMDFDATDCREWDITPMEWRKAIIDALEANIRAALVGIREGTK